MSFVRTLRHSNILQHCKMYECTEKKKVCRLFKHRLKHLVNHLSCSSWNSFVLRRIKTIVDKAKKELAAELLTRAQISSDHGAVARRAGSHIQHLAQKIRAPGDGLPTWAYWSHVCSPNAPLWGKAAVTIREMRETIRGGGGKQTGRTWRPVRVWASSIKPDNFSKGVTFQPAVLCESKALHYQHRQGGCLCCVGVNTAVYTHSLDNRNTYRWRVREVQEILRTWCCTGIWIFVEFVVLSAFVSFITSLFVLTFCFITCCQNDPAPPSGINNVHLGIFPISHVLLCDVK